MQNNKFRFILGHTLGIQTYQILINDDEVCIPSLSSILLAVFIKNKTALYMWHQHTKYFILLFNKSVLKCNLTQKEFTCDENIACVSCHHIFVYFIKIYPQNIFFQYCNWMYVSKNVADKKNSYLWKKVYIQTIWKFIKKTSVL